MLWSIMQVSLIFIMGFVLFGMIWEILAGSNRGFKSQFRPLAGFLLEFAALLWSKIKGFKFKLIKKSPPISEKNVEPVMPLSEVVIETTELPQPSAPVIETRAPNNFSAEPQVISIHLMSQRGHQFSGAALKLALKAVRMHFGKMRIFHYYEYPAGTGKILFSLASIVEPGYFDYATMDTKFTPGVSLFVRCEPRENLPQRFELMLKTAKQLAVRLGGELFDDERRPLNIEAISEIRNYIETVPCEY